MSLKKADTFVLSYHELSIGLTLREELKRISPSMLSGQLILSFFRSCLVNHNVEMSLAQYPCYIEKTYSCSRYLALSVFLFLRLWCSLSLRCRVVLWMCQHPSVSWASLGQLGIPQSAGHFSVSCSLHFFF